MKTHQAEKNESKLSGAGIIKTHCRNVYYSSSGTDGELWDSRLTLTFRSERGQIG
jgi:hypothetical protein